MHAIVVTSGEPMGPPAMQCGGTRLRSLFIGKVHVALGAPYEQFLHPTVWLRSCPQALQPLVRCDDHTGIGGFSLRRVSRTWVVGQMAESSPARD